jgi:hypothetical protein
VAPAQEHADPALIDLAGLAEHFQYVGEKQRLRVSVEHFPRREENTM